MTVINSFPGIVIHFAGLNGAFGELRCIFFHDQTSFITLEAIIILIVTSFIISYMIKIKVTTEIDQE